MTTLYRCDGTTAEGKACGETLPGRALPRSWVYVVVNGKGVDLCLKCELRRRAEKAAQ